MLILNILTASGTNQIAACRWVEAAIVRLSVYEITLKTTTFFDAEFQLAHLTGQNTILVALILKSIKTRNLYWSFRYRGRFYLSGFLNDYKLALNMNKQRLFGYESVINVC